MTLVGQSCGAPGVATRDLLRCMPCNNTGTHMTCTHSRRQQHAVHNLSLMLRQPRPSHITQATGRKQASVEAAAAAASGGAAHTHTHTLLPTGGVWRAHISSAAMPAILHKSRTHAHTHTLTHTAAHQHTVAGRTLPRTARQSAVCSCIGASRSCVGLLWRGACANPSSARSCHLSPRQADTAPRHQHQHATPHPHRDMHATAGPCCRSPRQNRSATPRAPSTCSAPPRSPHHTSGYRITPVSPPSLQVRVWHVLLQVGLGGARSRARHQAPPHEPHPAHTHTRTRLSTACLREWRPQCCCV
jgi:hypothetical protein